MYAQCCTIFSSGSYFGNFWGGETAKSMEILRFLLCFDTDVKSTEVDYFGYSGRIEKIL